MKLPLEIAFRGVRKSKTIEDLIRDRAARLEKICDYIVSCRITVEKPQGIGNPFSVSLILRVPRENEIVVRREAKQGDVLETSLPTIIRNAFDAARRQLKEIVERQRGQVKRHAEQETRAVVLKLFPDEDYGFLRSVDGREIYFHRNSVVRGEFDRLQVGSGVTFHEEMGEDGPQASAVEIIERAKAAAKAE